MNASRKTGIAVLSLLTLGCRYGPNHLDFLYAQRNVWQREIDRVEKTHNLRSRDAVKRELGLVELETRKRERAEHERAFREWLASLAPEERAQWMLAEEKSWGPRSE
jgi:hypothetical protein